MERNELVINKMNTVFNEHTLYILKINTMTRARDPVKRTGSPRVSKYMNNFSIFSQGMYLLTHYLFDSQVTLTPKL